MKCVSCNSEDSGGSGWFTAWKGGAICGPCSQRGLGGDIGEIDRYAIEQLPAEVAPVHRWMVRMRDMVLDESGEWTAQERAQLGPGLNFAVEMIAEELRAATDALAFVRRRMDALPPRLLADGLRTPQSPRDPEWEQVGVRKAVRATMRGWLNDLATTAESTGLPAEQLPELLRDVLLTRATGDNDPRSQNVVVRLAPRRKK
jgi:hypothetical protein